MHLSPVLPSRLTPPRARGPFHPRAPMPSRPPNASWVADLRVLDQAGWSTVSDSLVRGLRHALAGRLTALLGVEEMVRAGDVEQGLAEALGIEIRRLRTMAILMDALPASSETGMVPMDPAHHLRQSLALHGPLLDWDTGGMEQVRVDPETPAVVWNPTLLNRTLLIVLDALAGKDGEVRGEVGPGGNGCARIRLTGRAGGGHSDPTRGARGPTLRERLRLISGILVRDGGAVRMREKGGVAQVELEIPGMSR